MKKIITVTILTILIGIMFAELMQPTETKIALDNAKGRIIPREMRDRPGYQFEVNPISIITTYYDYMPGSYNGLPVRVQPEISQPFGYPAGGTYLVYHAKETSGSTRREYFTHIEATGNLSNYGPIGSQNLWEGYGGVAIDPVTADAMVIWHRIDGGNYYDDVSSYDLFHMLGAAGLWHDPFVVIDNPVTIMNPDDEFIWPYLHIGPSPLGADHRRVFVNANNASDNTPSGNPSENMYIGYADFTTTDLDAQSTFDWTYFSIPLMDEWHNESPWSRPFHSFTVSDDGKVAVMGFTISDDDYYDDRMFVFLNENYGEGDFTYYSIPFKLWVDNPLNEAGTEYAFENDNGNPYNLYFTFTNSGHLNAIFSDNNTKIRFHGSLGLNAEDPDGDDDVYWAYAIYPKVFEFDLASETFAFCDLDLTGAQPCDDNPMIPWDLDEDGNVDEYDEDGNVLWASGWPIWFYDNDTAFHENNFKIVKNEENGWLAAVWQDGLKSKYANAGVPGYEEWLEVPEIAIAVSGNNGLSWSAPIFLNALETPELNGMIPVYVYPGDVFEDLGDNHGKLHLFFLDDNSFGSSIMGYGSNTGGTLKYAALDIEFPETPGIEISEITVADETGEVGDLIEVEISSSLLLEDWNVISYQFDLSFNNDLIDYTGYDLDGTIAEGGMATVNDQGNMITIGYMTTTPVTGAGAIIKLEFEALAAGFTTLDIDDFLYNSTNIYNLNDGSISINSHQYGDIDDNGEIQAYDASLTLQYAVGLDPLPEIDPRPWEGWRIIVADVDGNEYIQAYDASLILQYAAGLIDHFPVEGDRDNEVSPIANVSVDCENNYITFRTNGELFAFELNYENNDSIILGNPEVLADNILLVSNIDENNYAFGLCTTEPISNEIDFLKIPFTFINDENPEITLNMIVNTETIEITLNLLTSVSEEETIFSNKVFKNFPNPFNPAVSETTIKLAVKQNDTPVTLEIFNIKGQLVKTLVSDRLDSGFHYLVWDGKDNKSSRISSGIYLYKTNIGTQRFIDKMILMK